MRKKMCACRGTTRNPAPRRDVGEFRRIHEAAHAREALPGGGAPLQLARGRQSIRPREILRANSLADSTPANADTLLETDRGTPSEFLTQPRPRWRKLPISIRLRSSGKGRKTGGGAPGPRC